MLAWLVHNLTGKIIIGPNVDIFFFFALLMTIPDSIDSTLLNLVVPITGPYHHHEEHSLTPPAARFPRAFFLPSLVRL